MDIKALYAHYLGCGEVYSTDSRNLIQQCIYFALKGDNFDGNKFAQQALDDGASLAVVDNPKLKNKPNMLFVKDVLTAFQQMANLHRKTNGCPVIAIAGSNGKTTTKELAYSVLSQRYNVHATKGNFNNHIGVPITLLDMHDDTDVALIEIGTNSFGEIKHLSSLVEPDFGLITNIGKEHLEGFGNIEGVAKEESELYKYLLENDGIAFINMEDPYLIQMSKRLTKKYSYGIDKEADVQVEIIEELPKLKCKLDDIIINAQIGSYHNALNIAAAASLGRFFNISDSEIKKGIESYLPTNNRAETKSVKTNWFILDAYNANPSSMQAAMNSFNRLEKPSRIMLIGDMFEMGESAKIEHENILDLAKKMPQVRSYFVGKQFSESCVERDLPCFESIDDLIKWLKSQNITETWFLVKGSRGMKMERVLEAFES